MSSLQLGVSEWTLGMDITFACIIELKKAIPTALTPDSYHLNDESRITSPLFAIKSFSSEVMTW